MPEWFELFLRYDIWKILAGALLGSLGKSIWDYYIRRQRLTAMVVREVREQVAYYREKELSGDCKGS